MKKPYLPYGFITVLILAIIGASIVWINAQNETVRLRTQLDAAHMLQMDDANLQLQLNVSLSEIDTDQINVSLNKLLNDTQWLYKVIDPPNQSDDYLKNITQAIVEAHLVRSNTIEDFKSSRAIINNSFIWLKTQESLGHISAEEAWMFHRIMDGYYTVNLDEIMPVFVPFGDMIIREHMRVLYANNIKTNHLQVRLSGTRTDGLIDNLINHLNMRLQKSENFHSTMQWIFIIGIMLSLFSALILYWRERISSKHAQNLANDLNQFVNALNVSNIVFKINTSGLITYVNDSFCSISGYSRDELIGQKHSFFYHPDMPSTVLQELWSTVQSGSIFKIILKNISKNAQPYYIDTTIIPMKNKDDEITEYIAVQHDVTELVSARDKAIAVEQFKDRFLSNMSHELRTPLNGIIGFTELIGAQSANDTQRKYTNYILQSAQHLLEIINHILDLTKIKEGKVTIEVYPFNLYASFVSLIERMRIVAQSKKIDFTYELELSQDQEVEGDWLRISQILTNLLSNAFKFTPNEGKVTFKAIYKDSILECKITDTGIGMDAATIERIFQPFVQADISTTRQYGGTGLGLSITKELLDIMEGIIDVNSRINNGSQFTIILKLPPVNSPIIEKEVTVDDNRQLHGHVLIVEDQELNRMVITSFLDVFGLSYTTANDGQEAVNSFSKEHFDLILMDENMPNMSGIEAMKEIRKLPRGNLPIIALTANNMLGDRERFLAAGMDDFIPKPITKTMLKTLLFSYLKSS
ncbi:MAG: response regulator [Sulfuricurvum sp.]|nr:response regulator [Sulfuricurvum sp.]